MIKISDLCTKDMINAKNRARYRYDKRKQCPHIMTFEVDERVPLSQHSKTEVVLQCIFDHHDCFHDKYPDCGAKSTMHELNLPSASV